MKPVLGENSTNKKSNKQAHHHQAEQPPSRDDVSSVSDEWTDEAPVAYLDIEPMFAPEPIFSPAVFMPATPTEVSQAFAYDLPTDLPTDLPQNLPTRTHVDRFDPPTLSAGWLRVFSPEVKYITRLFVSTRLVLVLIGLVSYAILPLGYGKQMSWSSQKWLDMWGVWDSFWYMDIAQNGYSTMAKLPEFPAQTNFPFFPLYPLLMRLLGQFMGGDYFLAGLLISNGCLLASAYLLYRLVEMQWDRKMALHSVKYLFLFPVSFVLSGVFTESLFLCLSLLCFYLAKQRRWWLAGCCGALLSATRTLGVLMVLPLIIEYLDSIAFRWRRIRLNSLFVLLVPLGLLVFCAYNYRLTGDFLFFKTNQAAWGRELMNPVRAFWQAFTQAVSEPSAKKLLECAFFVAAFGLLNAFYKTIGLAYWLLGMYSLLIPLSAGIDSMPRFTLPVFPLFIAMAALGCKTRRNRLMVLALGVMQGALMVLWCTGHGLVI